MFIFIAKVGMHSRASSVWSLYQNGGILSCHWLLGIQVTKGRALTLILL